MSHMRIYVFDNSAEAEAFKLPEGYEATCGTPKAISGMLGINIKANDKCAGKGSACRDVVILIAEKA